MEEKNTSQVSKADELAKFKKLLDDGIITQEEFEEQKRKLLADVPQPSPQFVIDPPNNVTPTPPTAWGNQPPKKAGCGTIGMLVVVALFAFFFLVMVVSGVSSPRDPQTGSSLSIGALAFFMSALWGLNVALFALIGKVRGRPVKSRWWVHLGLGVAMVITLGICASLWSGGASKPLEIPEDQVIVDASGYGGSTLAEMQAIYPEMADAGAVNLQDGSGAAVQGNAYDYTADGWYGTFTFVNDQLVSFQCMLNEPHSYSQTLEIPLYFGMASDGTQQETTYTGSAIRWTPYSETIPDFWVQMMDGDEKTFEVIRVQYDASYAPGISEETASAVPEEVPDLEVLSTDSTSDGYTRYATGQIRNNTNRTYSYVQVEINLYKDDVLVGSTLDNVNNLGPGEIWEFQALILDDSANRFQIVDITGF